MLWFSPNMRVQWGVELSLGFTWKSDGRAAQMPITFAYHIATLEFTFKSHVNLKQKSIHAANGFGHVERSTFMVAFNRPSFILPGMRPASITWCDRDMERLC